MSKINLAKILLLASCILNAYAVPVPETNDLDEPNEINLKDPDNKDSGKNGDEMSLTDFLDYLQHQISADGEQSGGHEYEIILEYPEGDINGKNDATDLKKLLENYELFDVVSTPAKGETEASKAQSETKGSDVNTGNNKLKNKSRSKRSINSGDYFNEGKNRKYVQFADDPIPSRRNAIKRQGINVDDTVGTLDESGYFHIIPNSKILQPGAPHPAKTIYGKDDNYATYPEYVEYSDYVTGLISGDMDQDESQNNGAEYEIASVPVESRGQNIAGKVEFPVHKRDLENVESRQAFEDDADKSDFQQFSKFLTIQGGPKDKLDNINSVPKTPNKSKGAGNNSPIKSPNKSKPSGTSNSSKKPENKKPASDSKVPTVSSKPKPVTPRATPKPRPTTPRAASKKPNAPKPNNNKITNKLPNKPAKPSTSTKAPVSGATPGKLANSNKQKPNDKKPAKNSKVPSASPKPIPATPRPSSKPSKKPDAQTPNKNKITNKLPNKQTKPTATSKAPVLVVAPEKSPNNNIPKPEDKKPAQNSKVPSASPKPKPATPAATSNKPDAQKPKKNKETGKVKYDGNQNDPTYPEDAEIHHSATEPLSEDLPKEESQNNKTEDVIASIPVEPSDQDSASKAELPIYKRDLEKVESWQTSQDDPSKYDFQRFSKFLTILEEPNDKFDDFDYGQPDRNINVLKVPSKPASVSKNPATKVPNKSKPVGTSNSSKKPEDKKPVQNSKVPTVSSKPKPATRGTTPKPNLTTRTTPKPKPTSRTTPKPKSTTPRATSKKPDALKPSNNKITNKLPNKPVKPSASTKAPPSSAVPGKLANSNKAKPNGKKPAQNSKLPSVSPKPKPVAPRPTSKAQASTPRTTSKKPDAQKPNKNNVTNKLPNKQTKPTASSKPPGLAVAPEKSPSNNKPKPGDKKPAQSSKVPSVSPKPKPATSVTNSKKPNAQKPNKKKETGTVPNKPAKPTSSTKAPAAPGKQPSNNKPKEAKPKPNETKPKPNETKPKPKETKPKPEDVKPKPGKQNQKKPVVKAD